MVSKKSFSEKDEEYIFKQVEKLTGTCERGAYRPEVIVNNIERRMKKSLMSSLEEYFEWALSDQCELDSLISDITIHTTSWYREAGHFDWLLKYLTHRKIEKQSFRVLCMACSTGEEVYSLATILESYRDTHPRFNYHITGVDIDSVSVNAAKNSVYRLNRDFDRFPKKLKKYFLLGTGKTEGLLTLKKEIRQKCQFLSKDVKEYLEKSTECFDLIICRNMLIYFNEESVNEIVEKSIEKINDNGLLMLGMSEAIEYKNFPLNSLGSSIYQKQNSNIDGNKSRKKILVIDDSESSRLVLGSLFEKQNYEVLYADCAAKGSEILDSTDIHLITLDLNMPELNGDVWLRKYRQNNESIPVVIVSDSVNKEGDSVMELVSHGHAQDCFAKSEVRENHIKLLERVNALVDFEKEAISETPHFLKGDLSCGCPEVILVGASTGGPKALHKLLENINEEVPPILIAQHISSLFAEAFARNFSRKTGLKLGKMVHGEKLKNNHVYIATGDYHICFERKQGELYLVIDYNTPLINHHRPSVEYLFDRVKEINACSVIGIILTGMGKDGAEGLLQLKNFGAATMAQDQYSSTVYGMPKKAAELGAAHFIGNIIEIRKQLLKAIKRPKLDNKLAS